MTAPLHGWFVTGTDTGAGKTVTAAALCRLRRDLGHHVVYVKPVQSGAADGDDDAADVAALAGVTTVVGPVVGPSLAPGVAARIAGQELLGGELVEVVRETARRYPDAELIVEGAGGLLVELGSDGTTVADLARELDLPLVVTVRPGLGTLNHTGLTLEAIAHRRLPLAGIVVSGYPDDPDEATRTNLTELDRCSGQRLLGVLPRYDLGAPDPLVDVAHHLGSRFGGRWTGPTLRTAPPTRTDRA